MNAITRTNLSYDAAMSALRRGHPVRRAVWLTSLVRGADGYPAWDITDAVARSCSMENGPIANHRPDKSYTPHSTDIAANDWQTVAA